MEQPQNSTTTVVQTSKSWSARNTAIALKCSSPKCANDPFSDTRYGVGFRLHNAMQGKKAGHRCTGCGTER